jgi:hypothetical protein
MSGFAPAQRSIPLPLTHASENMELKAMQRGGPLHRFFERTSTTLRRTSLRERMEVIVRVSE